MEPITAIAVVLASFTAFTSLVKLFESLVVWRKESNPANQRRMTIKRDGEVSEIEYKLDKMDSETLSAILGMLEGEVIPLRGSQKSKAAHCISTTLDNRDSRSVKSLH